MDIKKANLYGVFAGAILCRFSNAAGRRVVVEQRAIDRDGKSFVADVKKNDLWYFPSEIPHSIQGLDPDGAEFMLVFDDGNFSESETVLLSDSMAHLPPEVLSKNFGVAEMTLKNLPKKELFIFQTAAPGSLETDQRAAAGGQGKSPTDFAFRTMEMPPTKRTKGGEVRIVDSSTFNASTNVAMAMVTVHPGGLRELHWHPNADEPQRANCFLHFLPPGFVRCACRGDRVCQKSRHLFSTSTSRDQGEKSLKKVPEDA